MHVLTWLRQSKNWTLFLQIFQLTPLITIVSIPHCFGPRVWLPFSFQSQICPGMGQRCLKHEIFAGRKQDSFSISRHWRSESKLGHQWHMLVSIPLLPYLLRFIEVCTQHKPWKEYTLHRLSGELVRVWLCSLPKIQSALRTLQPLSASLR